MPPFVESLPVHVDEVDDTPVTAAAAAATELPQTKPQQQQLQQQQPLDAAQLQEKLWEMTFLYKVGCRRLLFLVRCDG